MMREITIAYLAKVADIPHGTITLNVKVLEKNMQAIIEHLRKKNG